MLFFKKSWKGQVSYYDIRPFQVSLKNVSNINLLNIILK